MGFQVDLLVFFVFSLFATGLTHMEREGVKVVEVDRFGEDMPPCAPRQVCADVFNFTRTNEEDGSRYREIRLLKNCRCDEDRFSGCGESNSQLVFRETRIQAMMTCEDSSIFPVCSYGDAAKEKHTGDLEYFLHNYVYHVINCVCPRNDQPQGFYQKMTRPMPSMRGDRYVDYYSCRYF